MSDLMNQVQDEVQELIEKAEDIADEVEEYLDVATAIDDNKKASDPRNYVPLDDLPYGEERCRLDRAPEGMRSLAEELRALDVERMPLGELDKTLEEAREAIDGVKATLDDCTPLPAVIEDDEF